MERRGAQDNGSGEQVLAVHVPAFRVHTASSGPADKGWCMRGACGMRRMRNGPREMREREIGTSLGELRATIFRVASL